MIVRVAPRSDDAGEELGEALGRPVCIHEGLTEHTVVAHWPGLADYLDPDGLDGARVWKSDEWAGHLHDTYRMWPATTDPHGSRDAIWHAGVRLHPDDRALTGAEWAEIAHRLARTADIAVPGDERGCRWIAVQAQPGRLDLLASLIREDGTWQKQPHDLIRKLAAETRRIESDLRLIPPKPPAPTRSAAAARTPSPPPAAPTAAVQFSALLKQLSDESDGPLAAVRSVVEHTAHRLARPDGSAQLDPARHRLEWIAGRLHGIQQDLDSTAAQLAAAPRRPVPSPAPTVHRPPAAARRM
ncbi:relaxase/mobilization nuclease [Streptomyces turgidiscabies]|uniref:relaxase/mobilization nuclease n=1 Tax=Streptomyces TaxID=1883 RepID=UPI002FF431E9